MSPLNCTSTHTHTHSHTTTNVAVKRGESSERETSLISIWIDCRHETPVLANPIKLIHVDEELVVLDKPCSLPVSTGWPGPHTL